MIMLQNFLLITLLYVRSLGDHDFFFNSEEWYFVLFFFYDTSEEKFLTSDLSFSQVTEVDKREPRESFSKPRPHFWGRGHRPRPRNEQAEAEKCSPRFPFVYWGN